MDYIERYIINSVENYKELIIKAENTILNTPELGFKEWKTTSYMEEIFRSFGYEIKNAGDIPGFYVDIDSNKSGPKILIMCELDALPCDGHPNAIDGVAHACGHNAQCAALIGVAAVLNDDTIVEHLSGSIRLMAVPAEEINSLDYRIDLKNNGIIKYLSGKVEFLSRGFMDDVDLSYLFHTGTDIPYDFYSIGRLNGSLLKMFTYHGKAAHAATSASFGVNALNAIIQGLNSINAIRETFLDEDYIRIHSIITEGGTAVNVIPSEITGEMMIRGSTYDSILKINSKVNRALAGSGYSLNAGLTIVDMLGTMPEISDISLMKVAEKCLQDFVGVDKVSFRYDLQGKGGSDMGYLSAIMPTIQPKVCGATGKGHSIDYHIDDPLRACVNSAKAQLLLTYNLLKDNAMVAKKIINDYKPIFKSKEELLKEIDNVSKVYTPAICLEEQFKIIELNQK